MQQLWDAWLDADPGTETRFHRIDELGMAERTAVPVPAIQAGQRNPLVPGRWRPNGCIQAFTEGRNGTSKGCAAWESGIRIQASVLRVLGVGRIPSLPARVLRVLDSHLPGNVPRVVGTNASTPMIHGRRHVRPEFTATGDIDFLVDDRNRLKLLAGENDPSGLVRLLQEKVDRTFRTRGPRDFRLTNDQGYMVEFIRPQPSPAWRRCPDRNRWKRAISNLLRFSACNGWSTLRRSMSWFPTSGECR